METKECEQSHLEIALLFQEMSRNVFKTLPDGLKELGGWVSVGPAAAEPTGVWEVTQGIQGDTEDTGMTQGVQEITEGLG